LTIFAASTPLSAPYKARQVEAVALKRVSIHADGARLSALLRSGDGAGIVFLHGLCGAAVHFDRAFSDAALEGVPILAFDLPGFGETPANGGLDAMAEAVAAGIVEAGFRRPLLVAHSMASSIAIRLLATASGVVLLEGNLVASHLEFSDRIINVPRAEFPAEFARMQRTSKMILRYQTRISDEVALARYARTWNACSAETVWRVASEINREVRAGVVVVRFATSNVPLTCAYGTAGAYEKTVADLAARLPATSFVAIRDAAHYPMLDAPEETYATVARAYTDAPLRA
jgi:pimeloyl-ACP methyl ester carboxylesterase